ncbi:MAG: hypothetical protein AAF722_13840, partial [Cyanobacteria bacterium P01_C01_bin.70]
MVMLTVLSSAAICFALSDENPGGSQISLGNWNRMQCLSVFRQCSKRMLSIVLAVSSGPRSLRIYAVARTIHKIARIATSTVQQAF